MKKNKILFKDNFEGEYCKCLEKLVYIQFITNYYKLPITIGIIMEELSGIMQLSGVITEIDPDKNLVYIKPLLLDKGEIKINIGNIVSLSSFDDFVILKNNKKSLMK